MNESVELRASLCKKTTGPTDGSISPTGGRWYTHQPHRLTLSLTLNRLPVEPVVFLHRLAYSVGRPHGGNRYTADYRQKLFTYSCSW